MLNAYIEDDGLASLKGGWHFDVHHWISTIDDVGCGRICLMLGAKFFQLRLFRLRELASGLRI